MIAMAAEDSSPSGQDERWADKDAFVSYCTKDRAWVVDELLPALKANGISYTIDFEHFPAGMQLDAGIAVAAQRAAKTIAILTPAYFESPYCRYEKRLLEMHDPEARKRQLVPVWLEGSELPENWKHIVCADLRLIVNRLTGLGRVLGAIKAGAVIVQRPIDARTLADFLSQAGARQLAENSGSEIERISSDLEALERYKDLHEALHRTIDPRREVVEWKDKLKNAQSPDGWTNVVGPVNRFVKELKAVCREAEKSGLPDIEWTEPLKQAAATLPRTLPPAKNLELLCLAVEGTLMALDTQPTALNDRIKMTGDGLRLKELFRILDDLRAEVRKLSLGADAAELFDTFEKRTDQLAALAHGLPAFISVHAQLQTIFNSLRQFPIASPPAAALQWGWNATGGSRKKLRDLRSPENENWFDDLRTQETALEAALSRPGVQPADLTDPFSNYIQNLEIAFTQTDCDLQTRFEELNDFGSGIKDDLRKMMIRPAS